MRLLLTAGLSAIVFQVIIFRKNETEAGSFPDGYPVNSGYNIEGLGPFSVGSINVSNLYFHNLYVQPMPSILT